jgi:pimeloyl-ACP methyl ester carboxylesterase
VPHIPTKLLDIAYECGGPESGPRVVLLHGWPDDVRGWRKVTPALERTGFRWVAPWLRGFGPTRFLSDETVRDGSAVALAQDAFDLADSLGWGRFAVIGHDWGGRTAYCMSALQPARLVAIGSLAIGYAPRGKFTTPSFEQSRRWWYQWFMTTDAGAEAVRRDPIGFARVQWEDWSPPGWFDDHEFAATAESFRNPDWVAITLQGYRSRWRQEVVDGRYRPQREIIAATEKLVTPTLMVQGAQDRCDPPGESAGDEPYFTGGYHRVVVGGAGHFPAREAPDTVAEAIVAHLKGADG